MKKISLSILIIFFLSCQEKEAKFIESNVYNNLILIENLPQNDSIAKNIIIDFLKNNNNQEVELYNYSTNTKYFLTNREDPGGFSSEELYRYRDEDGIASFYFAKCKKDTTKKVGIIRYFNSKYGNYYRPDTIVGSCN